MGKTDKGIRLLIAAILVALYFTGKIEGSTAVVLLIIAGVFTLTSIFSFCPLYLPFGISTNKKEQ